MHSESLITTLSGSASFSKPLKYVRSLLTRWLFVFAALGLPMVAQASEEIYSYVDKDGTLVFTNIPPAHLKPTKEKKRVNTFSWTDELGVLRKVHRVNVTTYDREIREAAQYYTLPPALIKAVVAVESSFEPTAISPAGAQGLMQLMPKTGQEMQLRDPFHPKANIYAGTRYLRILANQFDGDIRKTIAGYNAGPGAVRRAGGVPNFPETQVYVQRVLKLYRHYLSQKVFSQDKP